ncbi:MAG: alternative ribosome rescue aminoacyl-tRNA hydrolase ArfB [Acidimicrobiia bacterium]
MDEYRTPRGHRIHSDAITWTTTRSGGPGGQHANTSDTAVTMVCDLATCGLHPVIVERLIRALGPTLTVRSADSRSQWRNRQTAWARMAETIDESARPPKPRRPTRPSRSSVEARLTSKRRQSERKRNRTGHHDEH